MNESILLTVLALWLILVGFFLIDKYLIKTQSAPRRGEYAVILHHVFDVAAMAVMLGGAYFLLLQGKAWVMVAFSIGLLWPGLPIAINYVIGHQVFSGYWDEVATENDFVLDGKIWLSVIISLVITLLMLSWVYYS
jgi:hypothetical protein